ncbi:class I SAM-dependent methyltransferase [Paraburkholderia adhaesiva]|uniref:class I SAM-dependent methyltransferase n=1 Tax=Paraburkholderia adhaesiva TaxID=2883244 RepID=UPI001F1699B0|nr:methyltransferase domain-containing protein [Paraburkholderia adhaesiva]
MFSTVTGKNLWASTLSKLLSRKGSPIDATLEAYIKSINSYNASQPNVEMLDAIRRYNHTIVDSLNTIQPLKGRRILDIGASPHGYALERCLTLGAAEYVGIGLDIHDEFDLVTTSGNARLTYMNAESLEFSDNEFESIVTMSTFEHIGNVGKALSEFRRVLKPGGCILISFEPLWTCSYGHHLHHLGEISRLVPDWAHLMWSKTEMYEHLHSCWPDNAPISVEDACTWIYDGDALNRKGIVEMRQILSDCQMHIEWIIPMLDESRSEEQLALAREKTGLSREDLMTKGLSVLIYKH